MQIRDELWGDEKPAGRKHRWWRETQTGCLQTYLSKPTGEDPHPEVPEALTNPLWAVPKFKEIHRQHAAWGRSDEAEEAEEADAPSPAEEEDSLPRPASQPAKSLRPNAGAAASRW